MRKDRAFDFTPILVRSSASAMPAASMPEAARCRSAWISSAVQGCPFRSAWAIVVLVAIQPSEQGANQFVPAILRANGQVSHREPLRRHLLT